MQRAGADTQQRPNLHDTSFPPTHSVVDDKHTGPRQLPTVASPGFVARRGKTGNYVMGTHGELQGRVQ